MDVSNILNELNDRQRDAVTSEAPSLLVLAGAGSGKTRVLVHRVAWIVEAMQSNPNSVMAVTFTNKAANEMKSRIQELLQSPLADLWCGVALFMDLLTELSNVFIRKQILFQHLLCLMLKISCGLLRGFVKIII